MKKNWISELACHYEKVQMKYPQDRLMILFDIDGTILDLRFMLPYVLKVYDRQHGTHFFQRLQIADLLMKGNLLHDLLAKMRIPGNAQKKILDLYERHRWSSTFILQSHHPFTGVLEVMRWFQLQPNTFVGLNTSRPEAFRDETLRSLCELGMEYRVQFSDTLLYMNPNGEKQEAEKAKISGIQHFQRAGYRVFAFVDDAPENLIAISKIDPKKEILLLHADTILESKRTRLPLPSVKGKEYDLTELISKKELPHHIRFVWHGINDEINLRQFLASDITWGECDVQLDPMGDELILRHDSFQQRAFNSDETWIQLDQFLQRLLKKGKSAKLDMKAGGVLIDKVLALLQTLEFDDASLWFNGNVEHLHETDFRKLAVAHPKAILQCPVDFLAPLIINTPQKAKEILDRYTSWGINKFSISWLTQDIRPLAEKIHQWGYEINIYNVPDLESFLQAVLLMPGSITSDFNFPKWHYFGRGAGEAGSYHEYSVRDATAQSK